ncbi:hypothetical protein A3A18_01030 [Candidatus Azambacteria bacterium RIFCSPLOWO2_01_FULL_44_84]|nr:MAG: hypothetical protein A3A18_01030 [Candidatus Azambacteria bacterium RIFCSPLOWO2_01_FULL_44_84]OGD33007.1 MAG: hypothetical protein A3C78_01345 [Candidatus Azambacteria bacterium RIFCSPHIGHO2_02_FULL_45_18]
MRFVKSIKNKIQSDVIRILNVILTKFPANQEVEIGQILLCPLNLLLRCELFFVDYRNRGNYNIESAGKRI